jgi:oligopeptide transport system permease protein
VVRLFLRRLLESIPTLLILIAVTFFMMRMAPGGPFDSEKRLAPEVEANLRAAYHLDEPLYQQFGRYLWNLAQGDFGPSFQYRDRTVTELIAGGFPVSLQLGSLAMLIAVIGGVALGSLAALRQNKPTDYTTMAVAMTGISVPNFVLAPLLITVATGMAYRLLRDWGGLEREQAHLLMVLHEGEWLRPWLGPVGETLYVLLNGLGLLWMLASGGAMAWQRLQRQWGGRTGADT